MTNDSSTGAVPVSGCTEKARMTISSGMIRFFSDFCTEPIVSPTVPFTLSQFGSQIPANAPPRIIRMINRIKKPLPRFLGGLWLS